MKKRVISLILVLATLFAFAPGAFAADKLPIVRVQINYTAPKPGTKPQDPEVLIKYRDGSDQLQNLTSSLDDSIFIYWEWREAGAEEPMTGSFINDAAYDLVVIVENLQENYDISGAEIFINGVSTTPGDVMSVKDKDVIFKMGNLKSTSDITPAVSVKVEDGKAEKVYDGKEATLSASVTNRMNGISYKFQWYKDKNPLDGATLETLKVKNVKDSGAYTCRVTASAAYAAETKTTESLPISVKITPLAVTLTLEDAEKNSDEEDPELTYTLLPEAPDKLEGEPVREAGEAEGGYEITIGTLAFPEEAADNYTVTVRNGHFTIVGTGVQTFNRLDEVSDLTHIVGKKGAKIGVRATRDALPQGTVLALSMLQDTERVALTNAAEGTKIMKSLSVSVSGGESNALNKNAVIKLRIPLTEEEERFDVTTMAALFMPAAGAVEKIPLHREKDELTDVAYLTVEIHSPGALAILEGELLPEENSGDGEGAANNKSTEKKGKDATWLWILIALIAVGAAGAIVWMVVRAKLSDAAVKGYPREKSPAPASPASGGAGKTVARRPAPGSNPAAGETRTMPPVSGARTGAGETRAIPTVSGARPTPRRTPAPAQDLDDNTKTGEIVAPPPVTGRVISFDDLEDD